MEKFFKHIKTITSHRHKVIAHCFKAGIPVRGLLHDLSKYSPTELYEGVKYYQGGMRSPNEAARETNGFSRAWMHHKGRNRHHFEYWTDYDPVTKVMQGAKMPRKFVAEMFCDRVAASKIYKKEEYSDNHPIEYFNKGKQTRMIHKETSDELEMLLTMLSEKGEKETFSYIKNVYLKNK